MTISGTPIEIGTFDFFITTLGGVNTLTYKGNITVKPLERITLVAYLSFDETSGTVASNQVLGSAVASGFAPSWEKGVKGNAIVFEGTPINAGMVQSHYSELSLGSKSFSIELWFKSQGESSVDWYLLHKGSHVENGETGATGRWIGIQFKNDNLIFGIDDDVKKSNVDVPASAYFNDEWTHIVCVRDVDNKKIKIYLDGDMVGEAMDVTGDIDGAENMVIVM